MDFASIDDVRRGGFVGEVAVSALQASRCRDVPDEPGVYLVLRPDASSPDFLPEGTGGRSKGKDPDVEVACLQRKWVEGAVVLNIGKAGGPDVAETLKDRLNKYMRFGQRKSSGHSGGRYIWQLRDSGDLLVCWKVTGKAVPEDVEKGLISEFERKYGKLPFANLRH
jgi:hypothetical protein